MLSCPGCGASYDVSEYKPGRRLRCNCGQILTVPDAGVHPRPAHTLHCASCGGNLEKGRDTCPFCGALVDLSSARLTAYCPDCLTMSPEGARFCAGCGKPLVAEPSRPETASERCPRCAVPMRNRTLDERRILECPVCLGMFVSVETFETLIRKQEERVGASAEGARKSVLHAEPVTYIKCPECGGVMNRMNYGRISGVIVDYCRNHGYWLDNGELEKIAEFVSSGGLKQRYQLEMEEAKSAAARAKAEASGTSAFTAPMSAGAMDAGAASESGVWGFIKLISELFD